jgi:hypothetical protein
MIASKLPFHQWRLLMKSPVFTITIHLSRAGGLAMSYEICPETHRVSVAADHNPPMAIHT